MRSIKIKMLSVFLTIIAVMLMLTSCGGSSKECRREVYALDTLITITAYGKNAENGINAAQAEIMRLERLFSVTDPDSDISKINASAGEYTEVSEETSEIITRALEISELTSGAFDISVYPAVSLWGFTTGEYHVPDSEEIENVLKNIDYNKISVEGNQVRIDEGMALDLGAIAKGYISGKVVQTLKESGVTSATVNLGGNVYTVGLHSDGSQWRIGIKDPESSGNFAVINCDETALVTSGAYQRNFTEDGVTYHHIINPDTARPADSGIASVTVINTDPTLCDALSTAFYILGVEKSQSIAKELGVDYVILTDDGKVYVSDGIRSSIEVSDGFDLI